MEKRVHNFSAGPGVLPEEVLLEVQKNLFNYKGQGLSVMEMSHRSKAYGEIIETTKERMLRIMDLSKDEYDVLFLQGGASTQFLMIPLNLCADDKVANYVDTGTWSTKAWKEAQKIGKKMHIAASSKDGDFTFIPKEFKLSENPAYLHITTNNTIRGTEFKFDPEVPADVPLIADMSSNFLSKPMDFKKYDLIYGGAQKNIGPAGCTFVVIKKSLQEKFQSGLPTMLDYKTHIEKESMFNTPPAFAIYVVGEVLKWIEDKGGLAEIEKRNIKKAGYIYDVIDNSDFYTCPVVKEDRSLMNIPFRLPTPELEAKFMAEAAEKDLVTLKGHRSVGGCRASVYNAMKLESAKALSEFMIEFEKNNK
ncbi:MAG: 3-phosphoserine/phosphohydroxythreonine aminotransferase [Candidatus Cloacimonadota bacterium]|nr:MAG: 3-phosphoserine/phosphohydroxythreonine aminotransferase [Candidatus Cloacimonadota bacterium]